MKVLVSISSLALSFILVFTSCKSKSPYDTFYDEGAKFEAQKKERRATPSLEIPTRKLRVTPEPGYNDKFKTYSVVVATLPNAQKMVDMRKAFANEYEPVVIVKNREGLYYFMLGSYDDKDKAVEKLDKITRRYLNAMKPTELNRKYGTYFNNLWILVKEDIYDEVVQ